MFEFERIQTVQTVSAFVKSQLFFSVSKFKLIVLLDHAKVCEKLEKAELENPEMQFKKLFFLCF